MFTARVPPSERCIEEAPGVNTSSGVNLPQLFSQNLFWNSIYEYTLTRIHTCAHAQMGQGAPLTPAVLICLWLQSTGVEGARVEQVVLVQEGRWGG